MIINDNNLDGIKKKNDNNLELGIFKRDLLSSIETPPSNLTSFLRLFLSYPETQLSKT